MNLPELLHSLSDSERNFIANLDYGSDREHHRVALDVVIGQEGVVDFNAQGFWYPYEVIELGKNWLQEGHEREYAACMGIVLKNIATGGDRCNDLDDILEYHYDSLKTLPCELRRLLDAIIDQILTQSNPSDQGSAAPPRASV